MRKVSTAILTAMLALSLSAYALALDIFEIPQETEIPTEAWGALQVPCIKTRSTLYECSNPAYWQDVVDAEDAALIKPFGYGLAIYDHANSEAGRGIWRVEDMTVGCAAFLLREGKGETCYQCVEICLAEQRGNTYLCRGQTIQPQQDEIMCVSCAERDGWVFAAIFKKLGDMP